MSEAGPIPAPNRRWFRFSLRTFLVGMVLLGGAFAWVGYHLNWIRERQAIVTRSDVRAAKGSYFLEPPPVAPWPLRLFDKTAYRSVTIVFVDQQRTQSDDEMYVDADDPRLTQEERQQLERVVRLFPEARTYACFRKTRP